MNTGNATISDAIDQRIDWRAYGPEDAVAGSGSAALMMSNSRLPR